MRIGKSGGRYRRRSWTVLLRASLGALLCAMIVGRADADGHPFGISLNGEHLSHPDLVSGLGAVWTRTSVSWAAMEPSNTTPDNYLWASADSNFAALEAVGLTPIVLVWKNPSWAAATSCGPITDTANFAEFVGALAERYDGDGDYDGDGHEDGLAMPNVTHWEFYNEPDCYDDENDGYPDDFVGEWLGGCWGSNGAEYAQLLAVVWEAMHVANEETVVLLGSLAAEPTLPFNFSLSGGDFLDDVTVSFAGSLLRVVDKYGLEVQIGDGGPGDADGTVNGEVSVDIGGSPVYVETQLRAVPKIRPGAGGR